MSKGDNSWRTHRLLVMQGMTELKEGQQAMNTKMDGLWRCNGELLQDFS